MHQADETQSCRSERPDEEFEELRFTASKPLCQRSSRDAFNSSQTLKLKSKTIYTSNLLLR